MTNEQRAKILKLREDCTICNHSSFRGFIPIEGKENAFYKCSCTEKIGRLTRYYMAGIPDQFIYKNLKDDFIYDIPERYTKYFNQIDKWVKRGVGLYLHGPNGSGKTFLLAEISKRAIDLGYKVKFFKLATFIDATLKSTRDPVAEEFLHEVKEADLICIDEMEKIYMRHTLGASENQLTSVIYDELFRSSIHEKKAICATANCDLAGLESIYGRHLISLFHEGLISIKITNPDARKLIGDNILKELDEEEGEEQ